MHDVNITGMGWGLSLVYFGIPAGLMALGFYMLMPWLIRQGMQVYYAYMAGMGLPLAIMLAASLVAFRAEGHPLEWESLKTRFRYQPMGWQDWLWTIGIFALEVGANMLLARFSQRLITQGAIRIPGWLPTFLDPRTIFTTETLDQAVGGLRGNWGVFVLSALLLVVNVVGEEFWWRGYILPRQEVAFGQWTWVIHGVLWTLFHAYKWWDLIALLPMSLGLSFVVSRLRNNTPGMVIHFVGNGTGLIPILMGVLGM